MTTPGPPQTVTRQYVTAVRLALRAGLDAGARLDTAARTLNAPEVLSAFWELDFDSDPTAVDLDADGNGDWEHRGGSTFDVTGLRNGIWDANKDVPPLDTCPHNDFGEITTVEVRFRNDKVGGNGAVFWINADWADGTCGPIFGYLQRQGDDTQTLTVYHKLDAVTDAPLVTVPGLSDGFITLRLLIDPDPDTVNVKVDGQDKGTHYYNSFAPSHGRRFATLRPSGSDAEFDHVRIRVGGTD